LINLTVEGSRFRVQGSEVQRFRGSGFKVYGFKGSEVQRSGLLDLNLSTFEPLNPEPRNGL